MGSAGFYDAFIGKQVESGINDRIYGLYRKLCDAGLNPDSQVLEIGCGIGTLTYLLSRKIKKGSIEATDISPKSIAYAQQHLISNRVRFTAADIMHFIPGKSRFDFILLFDVLEHIPLEQHPALFKQISGWMDDESQLLINIPNPAYILFDQAHNPSVLQETDQPVYTAPLSSSLESAGLEIVSLETYSVWVKEDYRYFRVRKRKPFREDLLSAERNILQKGLKWLGRKWRKRRFPYPPAL